MASLNFTWSSGNPDGSPITYNLYEDGAKVVSDIAQLTFSLLMDGKDFGSYDYYVTSYDTTTKLESIPSETLTVNFTIPSAPTGLSVSWE